jgi:ubiquinol-cytochrome c reductase cytochrome b subunit
MFLLHVEGSSSPIGIENFDYVNFYPYLIIKDLFSFVLIFLSIYLYLVFFNPNKLGDSLNYVPADDVKTPIHIVPEWYFLPFYCMLRCIHDKVLGILCMIGSMVIVAFLAILPNSIIPTKFDILYKFFFTCFVITCLNLMWLATQFMTDYIIFHSRIWTILYFLFFPLLYLNCILESNIFINFKKN